MRTELISSASEMVCCARVMVPVCDQRVDDDDGVSSGCLGARWRWCQLTGRLHSVGVCQCDRTGTGDGRTYGRRRRGVTRGRTLVWWAVEARAGTLEDRLLFDVVANERITGRGAHRGAFWCQAFRGWASGLGLIDDWCRARMRCHDLRRTSMVPVHTRYQRRFCSHG